MSPSIEKNTERPNFLAAEIIAAVLFIAMLAVPAFAAYSVPNFDDVPNKHDYYAAVMGLREDGAIDGYPDNTFRPDNNVWRAQFAKMIVTTLGMTNSLGFHSTEGMIAPFTDLDANDPATLYPHEYVGVAADRGVTQGTAPGIFSPWTNITRAQVVTMAVRAGKQMYPAAVADPPAWFTSVLGDDFSPAHAENMRNAEWNHLLDGLVGFGSSWDPWAPATRGEVAQILWNMRCKS